MKYLVAVYTKQVNNFAPPLPGKSEFISVNNSKARMKLEFNKY